MVAEPWILKMRNQVSTNLKQALYFDNNGKKERGVVVHERQTIGILSFEVANVMSKVVHLHKSLSENEISRLKNEIFNSEGVKALVSSDEKHLLELALLEKLGDLNRVAGVVSRLGKKCTVAALQGFEHVYGDIVSGAIDCKELGFLVKDMESMVKKMERYVNTTASLYGEMGAVNELELAVRKFQPNQHLETKRAVEQKLAWKKQDVRHLKDVSLWNRTFDKIVDMLARTVCSIHAQIYIVFRDFQSKGDILNVLNSQVILSKSLWGVKPNSGQIAAFGHVQKDSTLIKSVSTKSNGHYHSARAVSRRGLEKKTEILRSKMGMPKSEGGLFGPDDFNFACGIGPGRLFMECLSLSSSTSKVDYDDDDDCVSYDDQSSQISGHFSIPSGLKKEQPNLSRGRHPANVHPGQAKGTFGYDSRLMAYASPNTIGGSALSLHYANVIIVLEKLVRYPHLIGNEARNDLYHMLPTSLRKTLRTNLKSYVKDLAIYDAPLAHSWRVRLDIMLKWLAPLAHNMIKWQSERNFEQQQIVTKTNVLLLQTLYFADREKTEAAICEILVGLNYICRYEQQQNALLDCASSFDFENCMQWQAQVGSSFGS